MTKRTRRSLRRYFSKEAFWGSGFPVRKNQSMGAVVSEGGRGKLLARSSHTVAAPDTPGGLVKNLALAPLPEFLTQEVWGGPGYFPTLPWLWVLTVL